MSIKTDGEIATETNELVVARRHNGVQYLNAKPESQAAKTVVLQ